jgi:UDP-N-acetylmuramate dehydrogenase
MSDPAADRLASLAALMPALRGRLLAGQPLAPLTWFRVGGAAEILFTPADEADLAYFLAACPQSLPVQVIGVGSNLIVRDGGVPGVVVRLSPRGFGQVATEGELVRAGAAALDKRVAEVAAEAGLGGLEFYHGIPGTIGGAVAPGFDDEDDRVDVGEGVDGRDEARHDLADGGRAVARVAHLLPVGLRGAVASHETPLETLKLIAQLAE